MNKFLSLFEEMIRFELKTNHKYTKYHTDMALYLILDKHRTNEGLIYAFNSKLDNYEFSVQFRQIDIVDHDTYIIWHMLQGSNLFWHTYTIYNLGMSFSDYEFSDMCQ